MKKSQLKPAQQMILDYIHDELMYNPNLRFAQLLFNLGINNFADPVNPENKDFLLVDIYNDSDEKVLERIQAKCSEINSKKTN